MCLPCDIDTTDLVHSLHPSPKDHAPDHSSRTLASNELPPGIGLSILLIEDILDDRELGADARRVDGSSITFECSQDLVCFIVLAFANQQSW